MIHSETNPTRLPLIPLVPIIVAAWSSLTKRIEYSAYNRLHTIDYNVTGCFQRVGQLKGRVALDTVRAVEFVDVSAFNLAHALQVSMHRVSTVVTITGPMGSPGVEPLINRGAHRNYLYRVHVLKSIPILYIFNFRAENLSTKD